MRDAFKSVTARFSNFFQKAVETAISEIALS